MGWIIPKKMIRVDVEPLDDSRKSKRNDAPVVPRCALAAGFPSIHPFAPVGILVRDKDAPPRLKKIFLLREEFIACYERLPSDFFRRQVDKPGKNVDLILIIDSRTPFSLPRKCCWCRPAGSFPS